MKSITGRYVTVPVNYHCPECMKSGRLPNIAGRFHLINATECQCNGCSKVYPKETFYRNVDDANTCQIKKSDEL